MGKQGTSAKKAAQKKKQVSGKSSQTASENPSPKGKQQKQKNSRGKEVNHWVDTLGGELSAVGLRVKQVTGDGNCFFRAVADQLGNTISYVDLRSKVVSFMLQHRADFEPFMEDEEAFDTYCARMAKVSRSR
ncbi:hypothetical protein WJX73_008434 [Symbiochloris irregularis]|uniref:OTU domain-containing protein n=1 Tax=Symbiochloris irregularis TaxID=706552 RepID=A0AAW1PRZ5_9CHLO